MDDAASAPPRRSRNRTLWRCGGLVIVALKLVDYRYLVLEHSVEMYGALVAALFAGVGIWRGASDLLAVVWRIAPS